MQKRILCVDDEPCNLEGFGRRLRFKKIEWRMTFAKTVNHALQNPMEVSRDMIVLDMCMPNVNGTKLLKNVQEKPLAVVKIVLSIHTEIKATLGATQGTNQFISKSLVKRRTLKKFRKVK